MEEKEKTKGKVTPILLLVSIVGIIAVVAVVAALLPAEEKEMQEENKVIELQEREETERETITRQEKIRELYSVNREYDWKLLDFFDVFGEIPVVPEDFGEVNYMMQTGNSLEMDIARDYFLQPEFYPNWEQAIKKFYSVIDPNYWAPYGVGTYPAEQGIELEGDETGEIIVFFKAGWGVETYQGVKLAVPSKDFDIVIEPEEFLLGRAYPVFSAEPDWARKIKIYITPKPDARKGVHNLNLEIRVPSEENISKWFGEHGALYASAANSYVKTRMLNLYVTVK